MEADCDETDDGSLYDLFPEVCPWIPITEIVNHLYNNILIIMLCKFLSLERNH